MFWTEGWCSCCRAATVAQALGLSLLSKILNKKPGGICARFCWSGTVRLSPRVSERDRNENCDDDGHYTLTVVPIYTDGRCVRALSCGEFTKFNSLISHTRRRRPCDEIRGDSLSASEITRVYQVYTSSEMMVSARKVCQPLFDSHFSFFDV